MLAKSLYIIGFTTPLQMRKTFNPNYGSGTYEQLNNRKKVDGITEAEEMDGIMRFLIGPVEEDDAIFRSF